MIQINNFGWRLGNQMFQIATAIALSLREDTFVNFPTWKYAYLFNGDFKGYNGMGTNSPVWKEPGFHYTPIPKNVWTIDGYFQSEKYFSDASDVIREKFSIKQRILDRVAERHSELLSASNKVAVHLRRGDYLNFPTHHPVMDIDYYERASVHFPDDSVFLVFSDDPSWCKEHFSNLGPKYFVIEGQADVEDFATMSLCDHYCIANSSFSWWAAWLNPNDDKIVVAPRKWFGPAYSHFDTKDLYCPKWIIV